MEVFRVFTLDFLLEGQTSLGGRVYHARFPPPIADSRARIDCRVFRALDISFVRFHSECAYVFESSFLQGRFGGEK